MPQPLFSVPIHDGDLAAWRTPDARDLKMNSEKAALLGSPTQGVVDEAAKRLNIYIEFKDFRTRFPYLTQFLSRSKRADDAVKPEAQGGYAQPAYFTRSKQLLDDARDAFRGPRFQYPAADKSANTGIQPGASLSQATRQVMGANQGLCLATSHEDVESKALLHDALDRGDFFGNGPGMLFIEELPTVLQADVDAYLNSPQGTPMPPALQAKIKQLDDRLDTVNGADVVNGKNWAGILAKAKENQVKVYGIDGGDADAGVSSSSAGFAEPRVAKMNKLAMDVMLKARRANPHLKFVASMGAAHANTHEGGIPGLAQVFDVPVVKTDGVALAGVPEDATKRPMPSKVEQAFIDRYIQKVEAAAPGLDDSVVSVMRGELFKGATRLAEKLTAAGTLTPTADLDRVFGLRAVADRAAGMAKLMTMWPVPPGTGATVTDSRQLAEASIEADAPAFVAQVMQAHAALRTAKDADGQTVLHRAVRMSRSDCVAGLVAAGCSPTEADKSGARPIHLAVKTRREPDDPLAKGQADTLGALATAGADIDAADADGKTAAHYAALNGNTKVLTELHARHADFTKRDARGWTARDVAEASTKVDAEKFFYANGITPNDALVKAADANLSTIDALMKATRCENPADVAKVRADYEKLYAIKELRPVLELLSLDAMRPRDPDAGGGLRIVIADADNVGQLYAARESLPPGGAYDQSAHVLMVSSKVTGDFAGTLVHEMTHAAARLVSGKDSVPFDNGSKADYDAAIQEDVKNTALLMPNRSKLDKDVLERMSGRMGGYALKYPTTAQLTLNQEFIVGVPQLIAQYGPEQVKKLSPAMMGYFEGTFTKGCQKLQKSASFTAQRAKVDDRPLAGLPVPVPVKDDWLDAGPTADDSIKLVRDYYKACNGKLPPNALLSSADQFALDAQETVEFEAKMKRVEETIRKTFADQGLPKKFGADALRVLAVELQPSIRTARPKDLDDIVAAKATAWVRDAKLQYVSHCEESNEKLSDLSLAEAIVIRAENLAWSGGPQGRDEDDRVVEVDRKKHEELVVSLYEKLAALPAGKKTKPTALVETLAKPLAGDKTKGFYRKGEKLIGKRDPDHVSIDVKNARRLWIAELANL